MITDVHGSILLVDDEDRLRAALGRALRGAGHDVVEAPLARRAQELLAQRRFDLLIVDHVMPELTGLDLIRRIVGSTPESERPQMVMMTAHATVPLAVEVMKLGAVDYLQKPFDVADLLAIVGGALERRRGRTELPPAALTALGLVGKSAAMQALAAQVARVADTRSTVLITGETGTGKELVARAIHASGTQHDTPFVKVNCAAIPETVLESELFGHVRGAFTDAVASKKGKFALADGGTILLDEIATMSPALQPKLLRVLQEREFEPLGAEAPKQVDVRVIASTNRDLRQMVADGTFQPDLFYRLNVIPIHIPPLRDRREDIPLLVHHFAVKHAGRLGRRIDIVDEAALVRLEQYDWPGNVRELENTIERAVVLAPGPRLTVDSIVIAPSPGTTPTLPSLRLRDNLDQVERETVRRALESAGGRKKRAAALMGISQRALSYYLRKHRTV